MKKTVLRDQATTLDGKIMTLHEHDGVFTIRIEGTELMSSRQHHSEEKIGELACAHIKKITECKSLDRWIRLRFYSACRIEKPRC